MKVRKLLGAAAASLAAFSALGGEMAPLNPAFLRWQAERRVQRNVQGGGGSDANASTIQWKGVVPSTFSRSYLSGFYSGGEAVSPLKPNAFKPLLMASSPIPSSYDTRTDGKGLTSVKDQNPYGTCWAHATIGCLETWQLVAGKGSFDYSENNLANLHGRDIPFSKGGNGDFASAYLLRWSGPVLEASDPYPNVGGSPSNLEPVLHVQNVKWIPARTSPTDNAVIKKAVMKYGAVYASYYHEPSASGGVDLGTKSAYWNPSEGAYYRSSYHTANHAVCIVGWDDSYSAGKFSTKPPADGAFLIKNSWGTGFGKSGYRGFCWISYYDAGLAGKDGQYSETSYVFADTEAVDNYDDIYQYDPLGLMTTYGYDGGIEYGAVMFVAREDAKPSAVGIYLPEPYAKYEISVYSGCTAGNPSSGTRIGFSSGNAGEFAGYQTIPVDLDGSVAKGTRFSAVVKITTASTPQLAIEYPIQEYSSKATANSGETFISDDGSVWTDFTAEIPKASFCCKVYTKRAAASSGTYTVSFAANGGSGTMADRTYSYGKSYTLPANAFTKDGYAFAGWKWSGGSFADCDEISFTSGVSSPLTLTAQWQKVTATKPASPVISEVTSGDLDSISVSWTAVSGAKYYNLYWCAINDFPSTQTPIRVSGTAYLDTERMPGLEIYYWVAAVNDAGESAVSSPKSGYRAATCSASPVSFSIAADGVANAEVLVEANTSWQVLSKDDWIKIDDGYGPVGEASFHFSVGANASTASRSGTITIGTSAIAHRVTRTISVYQAGKANPLPGVPEMAKAAYTSQGSYLQWSAASHADTYKVYRSQNPDYFGVGETCIVSGLKATSYTDTTANWLFAYNYRVAAVNDAGETSGPVVTLQGSLSGETIVLPSMTSGKFNASGGHASVIVGLIGDDEWEATSSAEWLTLSATAGKANGGFTATAAKNTTSASRMATVLIGAGYKIGNTYLSSATIVFTQEAGDGSGGSGDVNAQASVTIPAKGGTAVGYVKTPGGEKWEFLLSGRPSWITSIMSAGADVTASSSYSVSSDFDHTWQLSFTASENTGDAREWAIPIMRDGVLIGLVAVRQGGAGDDEGGGDDTGVIAAGGGSKSFIVEYPPNETWEFDVSKRPGWVTALLVDDEPVPSNVISFGRSSDIGGIIDINVTASANTGAERTWTIPITCNGASRGKVEVVQAGTAASGLPAEPETPVATAKDATTVIVSWGKADGAQKYKLWRADGGRYEPSDFKLIATQTGTTYTDSKLIPETTYCYKVSAVNGKGETMSPYMASVTTPAKDPNGGGESIGTLSFGPGHGSRFNVSSGEKAFVVGVSSLTWANFSKRIYRGEQSEDDNSTYSFYTFDDPRIVDAEKNSTKEDFDDCWCSALSEMNILFWAGWIGGYADEDAVKDYMRQRADEEDYDTGGWDFYDLVSQNFNESYYGEATSLQSFTKAFEGADRLFCLCVDYDEDYIWKGWPGVSHAVVCCGYSLDAKKSATDASALKALFIIDSDNDMYNGAGGSAAPDSITYCPVKWNASQKVYEISNVFGATGTFAFNGDYLYSIRTRSAPTKHITDETTPDPDSRKVTFNANGGKVAVSSALYLDGDEYADLPVPTRDGYKFDGWYTAKTGGALVIEGDIVDFSLLDAKSPALYAHWLKAYSLTLKGTDVEATYEDAAGLVTSGSKISVMQGDTVDVFAPGSYVLKGAQYVFQHWALAKAVDLGTDFNPLASETSLAMPAADVTLTATYVAETKVGYLSAAATADAEEVGDGLWAEPPFESFQWSVDGKNWYPNCAEVPVDTGGKSKTFSVQWRSLSDSWAAPSGKTSVTVSCEDYAHVESAAFTYVPVATTAALTVRNGEWSESTEGGSATMSPKDGRLLAGKPITFTAKANKNYVFVGWALLDGFDWDEPRFESLQATYKTTSLAMEATDADDFKIRYAAVFRAVSDYSADDMARVFDVVYDRHGNEVAVEADEGGPIASLRAVVGCATSFDVTRGCKASCYPLTFKTSGKLPAGLKFDLKTGVISGTPTKAESQTFYVTAADPAGHKTTLALAIAVSPLSAEVAGEYRALLRDGDTDLAAGLLELSVTTAGKVSAKVTTASGTATIKPELVCEIDHADGFDEGTYHFFYEKETGTATSGSYEILSLEPSDGSVFYAKDVWSKKGESGVYLVGEPVHVDSSAFADEDFKAAFFGKYYTAVLRTSDGGADGYRLPEELMAPGYLTATVDKKGGVKIAGKMPDGMAITASSILIPSSGGYEASALVFAAPSGYKKNGYAAIELLIANDGSVSGSDGAWVTPPLYAAPSDDFADADETLPGLLQLSVEGSLYSEFEKVEEYYLSLSAEDAGVLLEFSYNDAEKTKVFETVGAVGDFGLLGNPEIAFANNKVAVEKSAKIWKDTDGVYNYFETKPDRNGDTQTIVNPAELSMSFTKATGVFSGKFNLYFDYETPKYDRYGDELDPVMNHKAVSVPYAGVVVHGAGASAYGAGSGQYAGKFTLEYEDANGKPKTKTYSKTWAIGLQLGF